MARDSKESQVKTGMGLIEDSIIIPLAKAICIKKISENIRPSIISLLKIVFIVLFPIILFSGFFLSVKLIIFAIIFYVYMLFDRLDGAFARIQKKSSRLGEIIDDFSDKLFEVVILVSLGIYFSQLFLFTDVSVFILAAWLTGEWIKKSYKMQKNSKSLFEYSRKENLMGFIIFILLILTRNDARKIIILLAIALNFYMLAFFYFTALYLIYLADIVMQSYSNNRRLEQHESS